MKDLELIYMHPHSSETKQIDIDDCGVNWEKRILWFRRNDDYTYLPLENIVYFILPKEKDL